MRAQRNTITLVLIALTASTWACASGRAAAGVEPATRLAVDGGAAPGSGSAAPKPEAADAADVAGGERYSFEIAFMTHLDMDLPEQDVYLERAQGSGEVFRVTKGDHDMSAPLFASAVEIEHDPFNPDALGPYPKGAALGLTLGEWLAHRGTGVYSCRDGEGTLDLRFAGLVPDGVYTMWHAFIALPPTTPFSGTLDLPLGARDGSTSVFRADAKGEAAFRHTFTPGLEMSDVWTTSMLAINYHSDGRTYGGLPGDFGLNAHIPLFVMLPDRDGIH